MTKSTALDGRISIEQRAGVPAISIEDISAAERADGATPAESQGELVELAEQRTGGLAPVKETAPLPYLYLSPTPPGPPLWKRIRSLWEGFGRTKPEEAELSLLRSVILERVEEAANRLREADASRMRAEQQAAEATSIAEACRVELSDLRRELYARDVALAAAEQKAADREAALAQVEGDRARLEAEAAEREARTRTILDEMSNELAKREAERVAAVEEAEAAMSRSSAAEKKLAEREQALAEIARAAEDREQAAASLAAELSASRLEVAERESAFARIEQEATARNAAIAEARAGLATLREELALKSAELNEATERAKAMEVQLTAMRFELAKYKETSAGAEAAAAAAEAELTSLRALITEQERMLASFRRQAEESLADAQLLTAQKRVNGISRTAVRSKKVPPASNRPVFLGAAGESRLPEHDGWPDEPVGFRE